MLGAVKRFLPDEGLLNAAVRGGSSMASKDIEGSDHAVDRCRDEDVRGAPHPCDLPAERGRRPSARARLRRGLPDIRRPRRRSLRRRAGLHNHEPARAAPGSRGQGIDDPIVCSNINKIGFRMCGGSEAYETALRERRFRAVAMSVFASGAIPAPEAIEWVCGQPNIEAIVFGASSRANIRNTRELVARHWGESAAMAGRGWRRRVSGRRSGRAAPPRGS